MCNARNILIVLINHYFKLQKYEFHLGMAQHDENMKLASIDVEGGLTLDETRDHLKDVQKELRENTEKLMQFDGSNLNNDVHTLLLHSTIGPDHIRKKERKLVQRLLKHDHCYDHRIDPISNTIDVFKVAIWELEQEVMNVQKIFDKIKVKILIIKNNITCLESEKSGLERMRETCADAFGRDTTEGIVNDEEVVDAKKLFITVKRDLESTVDMIFPEHTEFKEVLGELTTAYMKGGGDHVYATIVAKYMDCVKFMIEANIATYHPNDKNKLRLVDLL